MSRFSNIVAIESGTNLGFGAGSNLGARQAQGEFLAFLNPDTLVQPRWLEALLSPLETDPRAGLATAKMLMMDSPDRINTCGNSVHITGITLCRGLGKARESMSGLQEVDAVSGAAFAIRRDLFEAVGEFEELSFLYMEDTELSWRVRLAGLRIVCCPDSIVLHDYALKMTRLKLFYQERNRYLMLLKNLKWPSLFVLLPALFVAEIVSWGFVLLRDRPNAINKLKAYGWIIRNWALIIERRRKAQAIRKAPDRTLLLHTAYKLEFEQAGSGLLPLLAHIAFDPVFLILRTFALAVVWW